MNYIYIHPPTGCWRPNKWFLSCHLETPVMVHMHPSTQCQNVRRHSGIDLQNMKCLPLYDEYYETSPAAAIESTTEPLCFLCLPCFLSNRQFPDLTKLSGLDCLFQDPPRVITHP